MKELDIQVGDRVTYENYEGNLVIVLICNNAGITEMKEILKTRKLIKIERQKYEVIEENKELLTEEEKEFLKLMMNFRTDKLKYVKKAKDYKGEEELMIGGNNDQYTINFIPTKKFKNLEFNKVYYLKELGLEE